MTISDHDAMSNDRITLSHGAGGQLSSELIRHVFGRSFHNRILDRLEDSAVFTLAGRRYAFTTDSYVIQPLFFPGGDIGKLAVCGTVNDLAVMGARPRFLSCGMIIEEGLERSILEAIVKSMHRVAGKAKVQVVTGDTKVVGKGGADRIFINTAGIGEVHEGVRLGREMVRAGDVVILSGTIGDHAASVLSSRAGLEFDTGIRSDCAPLYGLVRPILRLGRTVRFMRDPTRGGVAATLNELVGGSRLGVLLDEGRLPVREEVQGFCELLGYDPLYLANEGKVIIVASAKSAERVIKLLRKHPLGRRATAIGEVTDEFRGIVGLRTPYGGTRIVDMPVGEQFPRIC